MCDRCLVQNAQKGKHVAPAMDYKNFSHSRAWDLTLITHEGYLELDQGRLSPWLAVEGFKIESMSWDLLHNVYLGTGRDLVGSGLKVLIQSGCYAGLGTDDVDEILAHIHSCVRRACSTHRPLNSFRKRL